MKQITRNKLDSMFDNIAKTYGVKSVGNHFAATPTIEQKLMDAITLNSDFLQRINVLGVDEMEGEKVIGSAAPNPGKRTNTDDNDRQTSNPLNLDSKGYKVQKTEHDIHIKYPTLDAWAKFPDFYTRFTHYVRKSIAHGRIKTGFYGESIAAETDIATNPNGEDVNKGWIQLLREYNGGAQLFDEGGTAGEIRVGGAGDFTNLDALVFSMLQLIDEPYRDGGDLVAILGRDLLAYDKTQLYIAQGDKPTEKERVETAAVTRTYGGLPSYSVPYFPSRGLLITSWDNLSIYYQEGSVRQKIEDNAKRDRVEHYNTINECYVFEDEKKAAAIEFKNLKLWDGAAFN